jgi:hypothetical protein
MFDFIWKGNHSVPRASLYCVWIRARAGEDAPLIRVWIDPSMTMFESQATVCQADLARAHAEPSSEDVAESEAPARAGQESA